MLVSRRIGLEVDRFHLRLEFLSPSNVHEILLPQIRLQCRFQSQKTFFRRTARSIQLHVCLPVERLSRFEYPPQFFHRPVISRHRAKISLLKHPRHVLLRLRLYPNGVAMGEQVVKGLLFRHHSSSHRQYRALILSEHSCQRAPLDCSIAGLPVEREYFSEGHSRILLDLTIQLDEGDAHLQRQLASQRGLASSAQPDQRDALPAHLFSRTEVARQPEYHILEAVIGETFEESLDHLPFGRLFHLRGE